VELDPSFAAAWAELAGSYYLVAYNVEDRSPGIEAGRAAIQRALALDPADADTHYLLAGIRLTYDHDWGGAFAEMDAGRHANPEITDFIGPVVAGCVSGPCYDKTMHDLSRDIGRDPLNSGAWEVRGYYHYCAGELEAAESDLRQALDLSPDLLDGKWDLVVTLVARHKLAEALMVVESMPDSNYRRTGFALVYQRLGRKAEADAALQELLSKNSKDGSYEIAQVYSARGEVTSALDWLQRDYDLRLNGIIYAKVDPLLRPLAHNPRFIALMKKFAPT
jgi:tetratricopeptide (TPR) repeat protein